MSAAAEQVLPGVVKCVPLSANTTCQITHAIYEKTRIDKASSHSGRRSFIAQLSSKGVGVRILAKLAVHRSLASVMPYIDASDDMLRNAVELIG